MVVFGVPLAAAWVLLRNPRRQTEDQGFRARWGQLFLAYAPQKSYWCVPLSCVASARAFCWPSCCSCIHCLSVLAMSTAAHSLPCLFDPIHARRELVVLGRRLALILLDVALFRSPAWKPVCLSFACTSTHPFASTCSAHTSSFSALVASIVSSIPSAHACSLVASRFCRVSPSAHARSLCPLCFVAAVIVFVHTFALPFRTPLENRVESACLVVLFVLSAMLTADAEPLDTGSEVAASVLVLVPVLAFLGYLLYSCLRRAQPKLFREGLPRLESLRNSFRLSFKQPPPQLPNPEEEARARAESDVRFRSESRVEWVPPGSSPQLSPSELAPAAGAQQQPAMELMSLPAAAPLSALAAAVSGAAAVDPQPAAVASPADAPIALAPPPAAPPLAAAAAVPPAEAAEVAAAAAMRAD